MPSLHRLLFLISIKGSFRCSIPQYSTYYDLCYTSCGALEGTRNSLMEGIVLFNDALNTFYLQLYGVKHMVKDHSDSEREETCCHHMGYSF